MKGLLHKVADSPCLQITQKLRDAYTFDVDIPRTIADKIGSIWTQDLVFSETIIAHKGELAQLVERLHGMQEVRSSTLLFSTISQHF